MALEPSGGLRAGERVLWASRRSLLHYHRRLLASALILALSFAVVALAAQGLPYLFPLSLPLYLVGIFTALSARASASTHRYYITGQRVIEEHLRLGRTIREAPLTQVSEIELRQGALGRLFDYGTLIFRLTGGAHIEFRGIRHLEAARRALLEAPKAA